MGLDLSALADIRAFAEKAQMTVNENKAKYLDATEKGLAAVKQVQKLLERFKSGDTAGAQAELTRWADVNRTLEAAAKMDKAIKDAKSGVQAAEVAAFIGKALKVALSIGLAL